MSDRAAAALSLKLEFILSGNIAKDYFKSIQNRIKRKTPIRGDTTSIFKLFYLLNLYILDEGKYTKHIRKYLGPNKIK